MKAKLLVFFGIIVTGIIISTVTITKCERNAPDDPNLLAQNETTTPPENAGANPTNTNSTAQPPGPAGTNNPGTATTPNTIASTEQ